MGNCHRRRTGGLAAEAAALIAQLDAVLSLRRLPAKRHPSREPPTSQATALAALRYRFGCRWHYLHALKVMASQVMTSQIRFAFLALRYSARARHAGDGKLLAYLKQLRGE